MFDKGATIKSGVCYLAMNAKPKILMFDDDLFVKDIYFEKLSQVGFEVKAFENYPNVVNLVAQEEPDILLVDILVPGEIDGFEAIRLLKEDKRTKEVPIIIVTNIDNKEHVERGLNLGADNYLVKALHTPTELVSFFTKHLIETGKFTREDFNF